MSDKQKYLDRLNDDELKIVAGGGYVETEEIVVGGNLTTYSENVKSSESTCRDEDLTKEKYTKNNILL